MVGMLWPYVISLCSRIKNIMLYVTKIIFLSFLLIPNLIVAEDTLKRCHRKGGEVRGRGCFCNELNRFINPHEEMCLSKGIQELASLGSVDEPICGSGVHTLPITEDYSSTIVEESQLCTNPAKYVCDKSINLNVSKIERARDSFDEILRDADKDPRMKSYISQKSNGKAKRCSQLDIQDYTSCVSLRNPVISDKVYTEGRRKGAQDLFSKAKKSIIQVLEKRERILEAKGEYEAKENIERMKNEINEAQLFFGGLSSDDLRTELKFNAVASDLIPKSQQKWSDFLTGARFNNTVYLEGLILQADSSPESLYFTLLHELSHFIDLGKFRGGDKYIEHPFKRELNCLKREDSSNAQTGDFACFEDIAKKYESMNPELSKQALRTANNIKSNPDVSWRCPHLPKGESRCQMGQLGEAFADWMATEAFVEDQKLSAIDNKIGIYQRNGIRVIDIQERMKQVPDISKQIASYCSVYQIDQSIGWTRDRQRGTHPMSEDRLNGILLAHPLVKSALGCTSKYLNNLREIARPVLKDGRVYCGKKLYPSFGAGK